MYLILDSGAYAYKYKSNHSMEFSNELQEPLNNFNDDLEVGLIDISLKDVEARVISNHVISCSLIPPYQIGEERQRILKMFYIHRREAKTSKMEDFIRLFDPIQYFPLERGIHTEIKISISPLFPQTPPPIQFSRVCVCLHVRKRPNAKEVTNLFHQ